MRKFDWTRTVAVWQMVGSLGSAVYFLDALPRSGFRADLWQSMLIILLPFCAVSALAGRALYQRRHGGRNVSLLTWALQVPSLRLGSWMYGFTLGPYLYVGVFPADTVSLSAGWAPHVALRWHAPVADAATGGLNLVAILALVVVWRTARRAQLALAAPAA